MRSRHRMVGWTALLAALSLAEVALAGAENCGRLTALRLDHAIVTHAALVPPGGAIEPEAAAGGPPPAGEFCRAQITSKPTRDSDIRIEIWVPSGAAWNGKLEQVGNGGFAGSLPYGSMRQGLARGYAVAGTDDGHRSTDMTDASWALNHPDKIIDFGWRAIHETAVVSRRILAALTGRQPGKAYFVGCSDGGREALMMAQRYPAAFDGIVAGAPASSWTRLMAGGAVRSVELGGAPAALSQPQLALLQHRALESCEAGAAFLENPAHCHVDVAALQCRGATQDGCLTDAQVQTVQVLYADRTDPGSGQPLYGILPGAEAVKGSWDFWLTGADDSRRAAAWGFTWNFMAYLVMKDPHLELDRLTARDIARGDREYASILDSDGGDLAAFKAHGGKLIQFHGWNDPAIAPGYSLEYRERLKARLGAIDFYRLYMVPGMLHCGGGAAPTEVNWLGALEDWVEKDRPPGDLTAADGRGATQSVRPYE